LDESIKENVSELTNIQEIYKRPSKVELFGKTFKKESYNPQNYENTRSALLPKEFRNLEEENEKITLLNKQTKDMEVNLENLTSKRQQAKKEMEARF